MVLDPLSKYGPDHLNNKKRVLDKIDILMQLLTTDPNSINFHIPNSFFMPNPCDRFLKFYQIMRIIVITMFLL